MLCPIRRLLPKPIGTVAPAGFFQFSEVFPCQSDVATLDNGVNWLNTHAHYSPALSTRLFFLAIKGHGLHGGEDSVQDCFNRPPVHYIVSWA